MNGNDNKILYVLRLIESAQGLAPKDEPCRVDHKAIDKKQLSELELESILKKLESEDILTIEYNPFSMLEKWDSSPPAFEIKVLESFADYYDKLYEKTRFGIRYLDFKNYYLVRGVADQIKHELNIKKSNVALIETLEINDNFNKGYDSSVTSLDRIEKAKIKALSFLKAVNIIEGWATTQISGYHYIKVTVVRRKFDAEFMQIELHGKYKEYSVLNNKLRPKTKQVSTTNELQKLKLDIDKPKPVLSYGQQTVEFDSSSLEFFILKALFQGYPEPALDDDVIEEWGKAESKQSAYDACTRLNKKLSKLTGKEKILNHGNCKFWFDKSDSPQIERLTQTESA